MIQILEIQELKFENIVLEPLGEKNKENKENIEWSKARWKG